MSCGFKEASVFSMGLVTGTGSAVVCKIMYGITSVGLDGVEKKFEMPIFQTWLMFLAMCLALPVHSAYHWYCEQKWKKQNQLNKSKNPQLASSRPRIPRRTFFLLAYPAAFDLAATFVANVGLLYVTVSIFQLMKCTIIIFVAVLKVTVLKEKLLGYMWLGIFINAIAACLVGLTSLADEDDQVNNATGGSPVFGILMIIASCGIQACQYVFEETLMNDGSSAPPPLIVVGMEGVWGLLMTTFIVYPIAYFVPGSDAGSNERFDDAIVMLKNSQLAQLFVIFGVITLLTYNIFAVSVTYLLDSIWHAILDNFRPITVWALDLFVFYYITNAFGEAWTVWSWLQLAGMFLLLIGTAVYNGTLKISGMKYGPSEDPLMRTPLLLSSASLSHSPLITRNAIKAEVIARRTPKRADADRVRRQYMTEYQPLTRNNSTPFNAEKGRRGYGAA